MRRLDRPTAAQAAAMTINPNPRLVALMDYAIDEIVARLRSRDGEYADWLSWAASWKSGERSPGACVEVARRCFARKEGEMIQHTLGQLAWGAKEACYSTPTSGWLVVRYIADAMCAFGIAYQDKAAKLVEPPTIELERIVDHPQLSL